MPGYSTMGRLLSPGTGVVAGVVGHAGPHLEEGRRSARQEARALAREVVEAAEAAELRGQKKWDQVLEWNAPFAKWFIGGKINVSENKLFF